MINYDLFLPFISMSLLLCHQCLFRGNTSNTVWAERHIVFLNIYPSLQYYNIIKISYLVSLLKGKNVLLP